MKIRNDFVTNSSSANYTIVFQLKSDQDEMVEYALSTSDFGGHYDGSEPYGALFEAGWPVKELELETPYERGGEIIVGSKSLSQIESTEELVRNLLDQVSPGLYDDEIVASGERFFIVGDPVAYESREDLERTIERLGGNVTGLANASFVIYCDKERFCGRWPEGYSYDALDETELQELDAAEDVIISEIAKAAEARWDYQTLPDGPRFDLFTGECNGPWYQNELEWAGWSLWVELGDASNVRYIPVLSEGQFAFFDPDGPAGRGAISTMPGAVETLVKRCAEKGITRENLRIVGGKISVNPFGDSVWEVDDYVDQWNINVTTGELRSTGRQMMRRAGSLEGQGAIWSADTSWQDTVWWPFTGTVAGVPYSSVTSGAVKRADVRHLDLSEFNGVPLTDMREMFKGFEDLQSLDLSNLDTSRVTNMHALFSRCLKLHSLDLSGFDTSQVTDMGWMFWSCRYLQELEVSHLDTARVTDMGSMFDSCSRLERLDLSRWNTSRVTDMNSMFGYCRSLEDLNLTGWDTSRVTDMNYLFYECKNLRSLDLSSFDTSHVTDMRAIFNGCSRLQRLNTSGFNTALVTNMERMFCGCASLKELDVSGFDTSKVTDMSSMFWDCCKLENLDVSHFDTSQATAMFGMFAYCELLKGIDLSSFDTSQVTSMRRMFMGCESIRGLDLSTFDTSQVTDMTEMFKDCRSLRSLDLGSFDASRVTKADGMFEGCDSLERLVIPASWPVNLYGATPEPKHNGVWWSKREGTWLSVAAIRKRGPVDDTLTATKPLVQGLLSSLRALRRPHTDAIPYQLVASGNLDKKKIEHLDLSCLAATPLTNMDSMFEYFESLVELDLSGLDTSRVISMRRMLSMCCSLKALDLSGLDTSQVTDMYETFGNLRELEHIDLSGLDTARVTNMSFLFAHCGSLTSLDVSSFNTSQVTNMSWMFSDCSRLKRLDLSGFDTSQVTDMRWMFNGCSSLEALDLSSFDTSQVTDMSGMFYRCTRLKSLDLSSFDTSQVTDAKSVFETCLSLETCKVSATWPVHLDGAIPKPTAKNGMWWSERDGVWLTVDQIRARGPIADTYTSKPDEG